MRTEKTLIYAVILAAALAAGVWFCVWLGTPGRPAATAFSIAQGESTDSIVAHLAEGGFIRSRLVFSAVLKWSGVAGRLQPGQHDLSGVGSYLDIAAKLTSGGVDKDELVLLVREGDRAVVVRDMLARLGYAQADRFLELAGLGPKGTAAMPDFSLEFPFLKDKPRDVSLEGYLFPDTYRVFRDAAPEDVIRKLLDNFSHKISGLDAAMKSSGRSPHEILTMASIVEREVNGDQDRRLAADLFWRRLAIGMPLQSDATVNYVTGKATPAPSLDDIGVDSRYNTYKNQGLPPGPVCNPGLSAIRAVLEPVGNQYWYFLTDKQGGVHFSRNLEEHNAFKAKYLH